MAASGPTTGRLLVGAWAGIAMLMAGQVDVDAVALRARRVHLLEPERRLPAARVDQILVGAVAAVLVAEHGTPERHHLGADERVDRDLDGLHRGWVGEHVQLARHARPGDAGSG